jgi:rod shape-determining protein MreC
MNKKILFILIITIVSFQLVVFSIQKHESSSWLGLFRWIAIPFHRGWLVVQNGLDQVVSSFTSKRFLLEENKNLQKEVGRLQNELTILTEQIRELEMKFTAGTIEKQIPFDVIPSLVIGRDPYDWFGKLIIDKGTSDEIIPDLTVVTYQGLVGRVEQTYPNYSIVRLILSPEIATGAILQKSRDLGVVEGDGRGLCVMRYVYRASQVEVGDLAITSGLGTSTPRGIVIGKVLDIKESEGSLFKDVIIQPECDFSLLDQLFIIRPTIHGDSNDTQ